MSLLGPFYHSHRGGSTDADHHVQGEWLDDIEVAVVEFEFITLVETSQLTNLPSPLSRRPSGVAETVTGAPMFKGGALSDAVGSRKVAVASSIPGSSFPVSFIVNVIDWLIMN